MIHQIQAHPRVEMYLLFRMRDQGRHYQQDHILDLDIDEKYLVLEAFNEETRSERVYEYRDFGEYKRQWQQSLDNFQDTQTELIVEARSHVQ